MKPHRVFFILFIFFILSCSFSVRAQVPPSRETRRTETLEEVHQFIHEYTARFMKLELDPFMELFSEKAVENRMLPYSDIREAYRKTIEGSRSIKYNLLIDSVQPFPRSVFVMGRYQIIQAFKLGGETTFSGDIQWDLIRENGSLKIMEVNYGRNH